MKEFCVAYNVAASYDAVVKAKTKGDAVAKVREVIGDDLEVEGVWEIERDRKSGRGS